MIDLWGVVRKVTSTRHSRISGANNAVNHQTESIAQRRQQQWELNQQMRRQMHQQKQEQLEHHHQQQLLQQQLPIDEPLEESPSSDIPKHRRRKYGIAEAFAVRESDHSTDASEDHLHSYIPTAVSSPSTASIPARPPPGQFRNSNRASDIDLESGPESLANDSAALNEAASAAEDENVRRPSASRFRKRSSNFRRASINATKSVFLHLSAFFSFFFRFLGSKKEKTAEEEEERGEMSRRRRRSGLSIDDDDSDDYYCVKNSPSNRFQRHRRPSFLSKKSLANNVKSALFVTSIVLFNSYHIWSHFADLPFYVSSVLPKAHVQLRYFNGPPPV